DTAARRQDHHTESVKDTDVTGLVDGVDHRMRAFDVDRDLCVRRDIPAFELKQETADGHRAVHRYRIFPDGLSTVGPERPCGGRRKNTRRCRLGVRRGPLTKGGW